MKKSVILTALFSLVVLTCQAMAYTVSLIPETQVLNVGEQRRVDVNLALSPGEELFGFNFALAFNPAVLRFDTLLFNDVALKDYEAGLTAPTAQNPDLVTFNAALLELEGQTGSMAPLASLWFTGIGDGTSLLNLSGSVLDLEAAGLLEVGADGSIAVNADGNVVPEPGTLLLLASGIAGLQVFRRRVGKS